MEVIAGLHAEFNTEMVRRDCREVFDWKFCPEMHNPMLSAFKCICDATSAFSSGGTEMPLHAGVPRSGPDDFRCPVGTHRSSLMT
jgi:hypothetical protein